MSGKTIDHNVSASSLAALKLFSELPFEKRDQISKGLTARRFDRNQQILAQNYDSSHVYFILSGSVRARYFSGSGKEVAFADISAGEMFGVLAALDDLPRSIEVDALTESLVARMSGDQFKRILIEDSSLAMKTSLYLANLVRGLTERVVEFSTLCVRNRIHAELLRLANAGSIVNNRAEMSPVPTHAEMAGRVSTHREAVTRELKDLEKEVNLIERTAGKLFILDVDKLQHVVRNVMGG